ncbi:MAG: hypothetical protein ACXVQT_07340 [Actinomycetota bacterium]
MKPRNATVVLLVLALALAPAIPAFAAGSAPDLALYGRRTSVGRSVISGTAVHERLPVSVAPPMHRSLTVEVRNTGTATRSFTIDATTPSAPFAATYDAAGEDITAAITSGSYQATIKAGGRLWVSIDVSVSADAQTDQASEIGITGRPSGGGPSDQVRALLSVPPIRVWATSFDGSFRCEATFPLRELQPGYRTRVSFRVTNVSDVKRSFSGFGTLRFLDSSGTLLWSSEPPWEGPRFVDTFRPGQTKRVFAFDQRVRWSGPLTIRPVCGNLRMHMPTVVLPVAAPGAPTVAAAIQAASSVPGSPFHVCTPGSAGSPTTGTFPTPDGKNLPPLTLRCWATVTQEDGFDVVSLQLVSPSDAPDFSIDVSAGVFGQELPGTDNMLAARWDFVVTNDEVRPFLSRMDSRALGDGTGYDYQLNDGQWSIGGHGPCGYLEYFASTSGTTFALSWITGCTQTTPSPSPLVAPTTSDVPSVERVAPGAVVVRRPA